jgi:membrane dipeptidase
MLIDLSHSSDRASEEVIEASRAPCCFSHTFARELFNNPRGRADDLLKMMAERGGVIGIAAVPNLISNKPVQSIFNVLEHLDHIVKLVGIDHVAIGTDCLFGDHVMMHKYLLQIMDMTKALHDFAAPYIEYIQPVAQFHPRLGDPGV